MEKDLEALKAIVETWNTEKVTGREFVTRDVRKFIEIMNNRTRHMITIFGIQNPEFYTGLFELAQHACSMTTPGAKVYGDGQDRTNV